MAPLIKSKIVFDGCIEYLDSAVASGDIILRVISDAPFLVKLISRGDYCAYGKTIYVPRSHLELATSKNRQDRIVAVAKLIPWSVAIRNNDTTLMSFIKARMYKNRVFYFIYEYLALKAMESAYTELIVKGFVASRKRFLLTVSASKTFDLMTNILTN